MIVWRTLLVSVSVTLALLLVEVGLRIVQPPRPSRPQPQVEYERGPRAPENGRLAIYHVMRPYQTAYHLESEVRTNGLGLRGPEPVRQPGADHFRIVALGDSHTFGYGIAEEDAWPAVLQRLLEATWPRRDVEVINAGIEALAIEQEIALFEERLLPLQPDLVILAYYWNDMPHPGDPFDRWEGQGALTPATMLPPRPSGDKESEPTRRGFVTRVKDVLRKSYLLYFTAQKLPVLQQRFFPTDVTAWRNAVLTDQRSDRISASWRFVEQQLVRLTQLAGDHDFEVVLVAVPIYEQMVGSAGTAGYQGNLAAIASDLDLVLLDPLRAIRAISPSYPEDFVPFDGHPTERIYAVIAEEIAAELTQRRP